MAVEPTRQLLEQRARMAGLTAQLDELHATNRALARRIERLRDPAYIERRARAEIGLVRPGERAFVVMPPRRSRPPRQQRARAPEPPPEPGLLEGFVAFLGF
jgi:cell division protein FtsB